jgi:threonine dehydratase
MDSVAALERIRACVRETPLQLARSLGNATGTRVYLKLENRQDTGAFKLRGAANKLLSLPRGASARGVVAASTGNHALAVSTIARKLDIPVEIFVSEHIHPHKRAKIEALQARVNAVAGDALFAELEARRDAERSGRPYVSPYNDPDVIAGQGTVAAEILRQMAELLRTVRRRVCRGRRRQLSAASARTSSARRPTLRSSAAYRRIRRPCTSAARGDHRRPSGRPGRPALPASNPARPR